MNITNYVLTFIALTTVGILYDKYSKKYDLKFFETSELICNYKEERKAWCTIAYSTKTPC